MYRFFFIFISITLLTRPGVTFSLEGSTNELAPVKAEPRSFAQHGGKELQQISAVKIQRTGSSSSPSQRGVGKKDIGDFCAKSINRNEPGVQFDGRKADPRALELRPGKYVYPHEGGLLLFKEGYFLLKLPLGRSKTIGTDGDDWLAPGIVGGCSSEQLSEALQNNDMQISNLEPVKYYH